MHPILIMAQQVPASDSALQAAVDYFRAGGHFMYPLLACLLIGFTVIAYKCLTLRRQQIIPRLLAEKVDSFDSIVGSPHEEALLEQFRRGQSSLARLAAVAINHRGKSAQDISEAVQTSARHEVLQLSSGMTSLDVVIIVAPLLGLLGTASGLSFLFQEMGKSGDMSDAQRIAQGIAVALNTTVFGLAITVPCVVAQSFFNRKIESFTTELEMALSKLVHSCQASNPPKA